MGETGIKVVPLTPEHWPDLEDLFGPKGPCYGCWCNHFRMPQKLRMPLLGEGARLLFEERVRKGPPPGLLAFAGDMPVGWLQVGPRAHIPEWNNPRRASTPLPDAPAEDERNWAASCFFVRKGFRGKGVTADLLDGAISFARDSGARLLEAAPMDHEFKRSNEGLYVGAERVFLRAGFSEVARQKEGRPLMRLVL
ncbi:GNAT family N-acetyltransferase [Bosea psychrotolerans]|uniref:Acetyltransferase (GNAT) family protein n=1 Tax=Bosea psychrotolerans TaxID=1871628 RepID=A0A2S4MPT0_9HYPH|nr:GNAT family N-acetyltransferase [Bosea psychrotolerans]POR56746.1 acetyltransferase (GNAT) family protein [Bosea psychrotolerans]